MPKKTIPAKNPEARLNQLINLAVDSAEEKLRNGTASSQIISLFLNLATSKAQLELEKLKTDVELSKAKVEQIRTSEEIKVLYEEVLHVIKGYQGIDDEED